MNKIYEHESRERERERVKVFSKNAYLKLQKVFVSFLFVVVFFLAISVFATTARADCFITSTLRLGSKGPQVACLQTALGSLTADGNFGPQTKSAVITFQQNNGLLADGVVGSKTISALIQPPVSPLSGGANDATLTTALEKLIARPDIQDKLRGPQGPAGPTGFSSGGGVSIIQPNPITNYSGGSLFSATDLSSTNFITSTAKIATLNVSGDSTLTGNLNVTGAITGTTINSSFTLGSIPFQGATGLTQDNTNLFWDDTNNRLGIGTTAPGSKLDIVGTVATDLPTYSAEFLLDTGWTSTDWTGDFTTGWTHTTGNTSVLSQSNIAVNNTKYQITYTVTNRTTGSFTIAFGGESLAGITATRAWGPTTTSTTNLTITPTTDFNGTIVISVKSITDFSTPLLSLRSSDGTAKIEMRASIMGSGNSNTFIGFGSGRYNTTGNNNTTNGWGSLYVNTTGNSNTAMGVNALYSNTTGLVNVAIGQSALSANTTGFDNVANGVNSLGANTTGYNNTANGYYSLAANTTGYNNTANGAYSLQQNTTGYLNTANGMFALYLNTTGYQNTASGNYSLYANTTGYNNTANGYASLYTNTTGSYNTANGMNSLYGLRPTSKAITAFADYSATVAGTVKATSVAHGLTGVSTKMISGTTNYNGSKSITVIDADSFYFTATWVATEKGWWAIDSEGRYNTAVGYYAGRTIITGDSNTFLGYLAGNNASQLNSASNSMALGNGAYTTASNQVVIGNTSITQTLLNGSVGIGTIAPSGILSVTPTQYSTGTASQSTTTITGVGTTFTSAMVGSQFVFANGVSAGTIIVFTNTTTLTVSTSQTVTSQTYKIAYTGLQVGSTGSVGIGTTAPGAPLEVKGSVTHATIAKFTDATDTTSCTLSSGGLIACSSDVRLKKNIENISYGLDTVMSLRPVLYNWNYESDGSVKSLGFIAQQVEALVPKLVSTDENGMKSLNTIGMVPILTKAIQEMNANFFSKITTWLADAGNGIAKIFVGEVDSKSVKTDTLCIGSTCVTENQLKSLLAGTGGSSDSGGGSTPTATCSDGIQNQDETGIDTGGVCAPAVTLSSIAITTAATKLSYTVLDALDIVGLVVTGTYSDATAKVETVTATDVSGFDSTASATSQVLTITIGGKTATYTVDVVTVAQ